VSAIKVGVLGGGGILEAHIRSYRAYADAIKVTAVADVVEETARRRAVELDAAAYTDFREMIFEADIDRSSSQTYDFEDVDTYAYQIGQFADCLRSGIRPLHTEKEGIDVLCLIFAAYEGARSRTIAPVFRRSDI